MSAPCNQLRTGGSPPRRGASFANPSLRISDADRAEVADQLARHYGDGRLDQAEFDQRLDQAMRAKTQSDLDGLFADLPVTEPAGGIAAPGGTEPADPTPPRHRRRLGVSSGRRGASPQRLLFLALVIAVTVAVAHHGVQLSITPWLWIGLLAFLWIRVRPWRRGR
jgi:hypothetical protein